MPNVLIRDVPSDDLEQLRSVAAGRGTSLQNYLRETVHAQATYIRRQEALAEAAQRLQERSAVSEEDRDAVLDAVETTHTERADQLGEQER